MGSEIIGSPLMCTRASRMNSPAAAWAFTVMSQAMMLRTCEDVMFMGTREPTTAGVESVAVHPALSTVHLDRKGRRRRNGDASSALDSAHSDRRLRLPGPLERAPGSSAEGDLARGAALRGASAPVVRG